VDRKFKALLATIAYLYPAVKQYKARHSGIQ